MGAMTRYPRAIHRARRGECPRCVRRVEYYGDDIVCGAYAYSALVFGRRDLERLAPCREPAPYDRGARPRTINCTPVLRRRRTTSRPPRRANARKYDGGITSAGSEAAHGDFCASQRSFSLLYSDTLPSLTPQKRMSVGHAGVLALLLRRPTSLAMTSNLTTAQRPRTHDPACVRCPGARAGGASAR